MAILDAITTICAQYGTCHDIFLDNSIPAKKLDNARAKFPIPGNCKVLALVNCTVFGSNKNGLAVCEDGLRWHNQTSGTKKVFLSWDELAVASVEKAGTYDVGFGAGATWTTAGCGTDREVLLKMIRELHDAALVDLNQRKGGSAAATAAPAVKSAAAPPPLPAVKSKKQAAIPQPQSAPTEGKTMTSHEQRRQSFQAQLDSVGNGDTLQLPQCEIAGPIVFRVPMVLDGQRTTIWSSVLPVVTIETAGVTLRNLRIEATGVPNDTEACALLVKPGADVELENVEVQGSVVGLQGEEGEWRYPKEIALGDVFYRRGKDCAFTVRLFVPVACKIESKIDGLKITPARLAAGMNEVCLRLDLVRDTLIWGHIFISSAFLRRRIPLSARIVTVPEANLPPAPASPPVVWEPGDTPVLAPVQPVSVQPVSVQPVSVQPVSVQSAPVQPAPVQRPVQPPVQQKPTVIPHLSPPPTPAVSPSPVSKRVISNTNLDGGLFKTAKPTSMDSAPPTPVRPSTTSASSNIFQKAVSPTTVSPSTASVPQSNIFQPGVSPPPAEPVSKPPRTKSTPISAAFGGPSVTQQNAETPDSGQEPTKAADNQVEKKEEPQPAKPKETPRQMGNKIRPQKQAAISSLFGGTPATITSQDEVKK